LAAAAAEAVASSSTGEAARAMTRLPIAGAAVSMALTALLRQATAGRLQLCDGDALRLFAAIVVPLQCQPQLLLAALLRPDVGMAACPISTYLELASKAVVELMDAIGHRSHLSARVRTAAQRTALQPEKLMGWLSKCCSIAAEAGEGG